MPYSSVANVQSAVPEVQAPIPQVKVEPVQDTLPPQRASKKRAMSEMIMDDIAEEEEDQSADDDDHDASDPEVPPPKRGGRKAAAANKGKKRAGSTASSSTAGQTKKSSVVHPHPLVPVPEYTDRPSKEEYDKLSSREKRQLRNKISARNFRHRRKAHIDTLEEQVEVKDKIIDGLREEIGTLRVSRQSRLSC